MNQKLPVLALSYKPPMTTDGPPVATGEDTFDQKNRSRRCAKIFCTLVPKSRDSDMLDSVNFLFRHF